MTEYYELVKRKIEPPPPGKFRIATAAIWSCRMCGSIIDSMGGPGHAEICVACGEDIIAGRLKYDREAGPR